MKKLLFLLWICSFTVAAQPFQVGKTTISLFDTSRNRTIPTEVFYPADSNGTNVPLTMATSATFPILSFGHGFVMGFDAYENFWETLVPQGYIIAFPKTEGSFSPSHTNFAKDLAFVIDAIYLLNTDVNSLFYTRVSSKNAVMGHSMGGGCALLAIQYSTQINHIITFAAAETNPTAIGAAATITIPSLTIAGQNDCVSAPSSNQIPIYEALTSSCKNYLEITGGSHCQMATSNFLCSFGEATCSPSATISREEQHETIFSYVNLWLDYYLKENCVSGQLFETLKTDDQVNETASNCELCEALSVSTKPLTTVFTISPNPFQDEIEILSKNQNSFVYEMYDVTGKKVIDGQGSTTVKFSSASLLTGIYYLKITQEGKFKTFKVIKN